MVNENELKAQLKEALEECQRWKSKCTKLNERVEKKLTEAENVLSLNQSNEVGIVQAVVNELNTTKEEVSDTCQGLEAFKNEVSSWFLSLSEKLDESDQYSKKNNIILKGFRRLPKLNNTEFIFFIADQLNYLFPSCNQFGKILPCHIDDAHPLKNVNGKSSVIVKFVNRWIRDKIIACHEDLRDTGIFVSEHLNKNTYKLLNSAQAIVGKENTWVFKCDVFALCKNKTMKIKSIRDINKLRDYATAGTELTPVNDVPVIDQQSSLTNTTNINTNPTYHQQINQYSCTNTNYSRSHPPPRGRVSHYGRGGRGFNNHRRGFFNHRR